MLCAAGRTSRYKEREDPSVRLQTTKALDILETMMLRELVVEDLFGEFTHRVFFKSNDGLTLLHGPNGVGKTMVLRVLDSLFNRRFRSIRTLPLSALQVEFDDNDRLQVNKINLPDQRLPALEFTFTPKKPGRPKTWIFKPTAHIDIPRSAIDELIPELARVGPEEWMSPTGEILDIDAVADRYQERLPFRHHKSEDLPGWLDAALSRVPVYFIEADRLSTYGLLRGVKQRRTVRDVGQVPTVSSYADDLAEKIKRTLASYADSSQTLDSTFPTRFLQADSSKDNIPTDAQIRDRYAQQAARRSRYVKAGLLDAGDELKLPDGLLGEAECRVLDIYLKDVDLKLDQLDSLSDKVELFLSIVNGKFRRKSIRVDRERGLSASTSSGQRLELSSLSSGEQQEIVLAYGLLFREKPGTLILLDEPELSLHVSWQLDMIPDLLKIAELADLEFLIATHSPQIVNDRWDLTVELSDDQPEQD